MAYISTKLNTELCVSELITIHYFEYMKNFVFSGESHDFWEFLYVDKGSLCVQADDRFYELHTGDIIFHKPNEFHAFHAKGQEPPNLVAISFLTASPAMKFYENLSFSLTLEEKNMISKIIQEAKLAFSTPLHIPSIEQVLPSEKAPFASQQLIKIYLELFLIMVKRNHTNETPFSKIETPLTTPVEPSPHSNQLKRIIQYMENHITEKITISQICAEFSISRSSLHTLFYREKHCGAMEYFNHLKLTYSKDLIRHSNMNITEIAHALSYSSLQYFSKQFKKATGMAPLEYASSVKGMAHSFSEQR